MSGEAVKRKNGKGKGKKILLNGHAETNGNGVTPGGKHEKADVGGAGLCTKLGFSFLFLCFALTTLLFMLDYKEGQLAQVASTLPPEVQEFVKKADVAAAALNENIKKIIAEALIKAEELSKKVPVGGDTTLADIVFNSREKEGKAAAEEAAAAEAIRFAAEEAAAAEARNIAVEEAADKATFDKAAADKAAADKAAAAEAARFAVEEATAKRSVDEKAARVAAKKAKKAALEKAMAEKASLKKVAAKKAAMEKALAEKAASVEKAFYVKAAEDEARIASEQAKLKESRAVVEEEEARAKREADEAAATKKVEEELSIDKINAEIEAAGHEEAQQKFEEAKKRLEESGVEFVSNDEFAKVKAAKSSKAAGAA
eukprot:GFUD01138467.1.p1 GENE.GFUD01138467.1~~GFUD01138467.1.p1  ORF type:complete len:372 (-),score=160.71 GFUD01138467.1:233-1348(-)